MAESVKEVKDLRENAIVVTGVSKTFKLPHEKIGSIKGALVNFYKREKGYERQKVLRDISFEVKKGEFFGIVGRNGSGKSTLLKLLAGIYSPDKGSITINGKLTPFIELGVGFNPELTGRENIFLNGALLGFNRKEMDALYDSIVAFAELEKFMDQKLKNYSSGMQVRLAFSIAIRAHSEIVVMDEVLAVGDAAFQKKCFDVFRELKKEGRTIILVTHDMANVERFCDRVLVLDSGKVLKLTSSHEASSIYAKLNIAERQVGEDRDEAESKTPDNRWGSGGINISKVAFKSNNKKNSSLFSNGEGFQVDFTIKRDAGYEKTPIVCGLAFFNQDGVNVCGPNTSQIKLPTGATKLSFSIDKIDFAPGEYSLTVVLFDEEMVTPFDFLDKWTTFSVVSDHTVHGLIELHDTSWQAS